MEYFDKKYAKCDRCHGEGGFQMIGREWRICPYCDSGYVKVFVRCAPTDTQKRGKQMKKKPKKNSSSYMEGFYDGIAWQKALTTVEAVGKEVSVTNLFEVIEARSKKK